MYKKISRAQFETLLLRRIDKLRVGTARRAKQRIGGAWRTIIDDMHKRNAERLSANQLPLVLNECAQAIVDLMNCIKPEPEPS